MIKDKIRESKVQGLEFELIIRYFNAKYRPIYIRINPELKKMR